MEIPPSGELFDISSYSNQNTAMERQISVDPISVQREVIANPMQVPAVIAPKPNGANQLPPLLPPTNFKFLSRSLPNSATSSPRFSGSLLKKKKKSKNEREAASPEKDEIDLRSPTYYKPLSLQQEIQFRRSQSCNEGISYPHDDFDLWLIQPNVTSHYSSFSKPDEVNRAIPKTSKNRDDPSDDADEFKCGALCLYLPGFGSKTKPVRARKVVDSELQNRNIISRTVSLEKFECGSWASPAVVSNNLDQESMSHYFDLPLELIRGNVNDAHSPVTSGFLFDKDIKGVLKNGPNGTSAARKSHESARHVRFSTSSPKSHPASLASCITPRLRKAREEFNAFIEAQSA